MIVSLRKRWFPLKKYAIKSIKSPEKKKNEDRYIIKNYDEYSIFCIADGVGGLAFADIASSIAIEPFSKFKYDLPLESLFIDANNRILKESEKRNRIMGSTLVTAIINTETNEISIANVGDSRAYIITQNGMWHTKDDTLVQELVDMGIITEEQAFDHPNKNRLNKALGTCESLEVQIHNSKIDDQSILVLCSDGLHDYVRDDDIKTIIQTEPSEKATEILIEKARKNGSTDDITIIIVSNT